MATDSQEGLRVRQVGPVEEVGSRWGGEALMMPSVMGYGRAPVG